MRAGALDLGEVTKQGGRVSNYGLGWQQTLMQGKKIQLENGYGFDRRLGRSRDG